MVKFPASVTGEIVVLTGEDLPHARRMRRATALGFLGQDFMPVGKTSTFVCVPLRDFELVIISSLNFCPKMMSPWFGSFSSSVVYLSWILMFGVYVMSRSLSLHDCLSLL